MKNPDQKKTKNPPRISNSDHKIYKTQINSTIEDLIPNFRTKLTDLWLIRFEGEKKAQITGEERGETEDGLCRRLLGLRVTMRGRWKGFRDKEEGRFVG